MPSMSSVSPPSPSATMLPCRCTRPPLSLCAPLRSRPPPRPQLRSRPRVPFALMRTSTPPTLDMLPPFLLATSTPAGMGAARRNCGGVSGVCASMGVVKEQGRLHRRRWRRCGSGSGRGEEEVGGVRRGRGCKGEWQEGRVPRQGHCDEGEDMGAAESGELDGD